jgi:outer membrane protein
LKPSILLLALVILSTVSIHAQPQKTAWTLEDCLRYATQNNVVVNQAELNRRISENNYVQSKLNLMPTISVNLSYGFNFGYSIDPTTYTYVKQNSQTFLPTGQANLNVFMGLQQINTIRKDKFDLQAYSADYLNSLNTTSLNVTNLFLQIVLDKELVKVGQRQVDISQSQLDVANAKIKAGTLAETSVHDFDAQLARDSATLVGQQSATDIALLALQIALQLPDQQIFDVIVPDINIGPVMSFDKTNVRDVYQYALQNQPSVKAAQARLMSALYSIKIARGAMSPVFSISYNTRDDYFNKAATTSITGFTYTNGMVTGIASTETPTSISTQFQQNIANDVSFNMSLPLLMGWQRMTTIANAKLQYQIQNLNIANTDNNLRRDVYQAYANAKGNAETYSANLKALESQRMAYETAQKRYNAGLAAAYELQQVQDNLARTESNTIQAKFNYIFSVKVLDFYQGKPITLN